MIHPVRRSVLLLCALLAPAGSAAEVWKVPSESPNINLAIAIAAPGDVVLVAPGSYIQVVVADGKGVSIVADGPASIATLEVRNLPADQTFVLDGFTLDLPNVFEGPDTPFLAEDNAGFLRFQDCTFLGDPGHAGVWMAGVSPYDGAAGARVVGSSRVSFHGCTFVGGEGADLVDEDIQSSATSGGNALEVVASTVVLQSCVLLGGRGGTQDDTVPYSAGNGGSGVYATGASHVQVAGCTLSGGHGGSADCDFFSCGSGGNGGDGVNQPGAGAVAWTRDNDFSPGLGGSDGDGGGSGSTGVLVDGGTGLGLSQRFRSFDADSPVREGQSLTLSFGGQSGDGILLFASLSAGFVPKLVNQGSFLLGEPLLLSGSFLGSLPAGGLLDVPLLVPELGPGVDALDLQLQPVLLDGPDALLAPALVLTLLDGAL